MRQAETLPSMQQRQSERAYRGADALSCSVQAREEEQATAEAEAEQRCGAMRRQYRHAARHEACAGCHSRDTAIPSVHEKGISAQTGIPQDLRQNTLRRPLRQRLRQEYMRCGVSSQP